MLTSYAQLSITNKHLCTDWFNFLAAFIGSVASTLVMHPLDTIKTRLQVSGGTSSGSGKSRSDEEGEEDDGDTKDTDKQDGTNNSNSEGSKEEAPIIVGYNIMSLYEGLGANILKEGPPSALYLGVYESVKYALLPQFGPQSLLLVYLIAGAAGETCGSIVRAPAEAIKSTVQTTYCTASEAITQVFGTSASRSNVVRAWSASIFRDVPFGAIQLAIFELTKR
jgi:solute carrier family 25 (mitochondrial S-adenosylmethionine transporter), member 26